MGIRGDSKLAFWRPAFFGFWIDAERGGSRPIGYGGVGSRALLSSRSWPNLKISFFLVAIWAESKIWHVAGAQVAVPSRPFGARGRAGAAECAQTAGGAGAVLRPERAKNRLPTPPERGPWRAERRRGAPTCHWAGAMAVGSRWLLQRTKNRSLYTNPLGSYMYEVG